MAEPAPLVSTPDATVPTGGEAWWVIGAGGARLRAALFAPEGRARGSIILSGGRTEPIEKYYETIADFTARGFVVLVHDWRGQGLSARELPDRLKGHARGYKSYLDDFQALLAAFEARLPKPWVAVGHSMGGCLTLLAMAHGERRFAGAVLSAPMLGLNTGKVSANSARFAARLHNLLGRAARYVQGQPGRPFDDDFEANVLTHDRARFDRTCGLLAAEPQLALGAPTWGWLDFAFRATAYLARPDRLRGITQPVIIVSAEHDRLVDNAAQAAAARHLPQGKLIRVPGAYHEILMETDLMRNFFMRALDTLTGRVAPKPAAAPKPAPAPIAAAPKPAVAPAPAPVLGAPAAHKAEATPAKVAAKPAAKKPTAKKAAAKTPAKPAAAKTPAAAKK
ncbi:MAG: pldB, partial [Phenylobacterium sp.]|nr:pldB [Phenylobacterium sp.]